MPRPVIDVAPAAAPGPIVVRPVAALSAAEAAGWDALLDAAAVPTAYLSREFAQLVDGLRGGVSAALLYGPDDAPGDAPPRGVFPFQTDGGGAGGPVGRGLNDFHGLLAPDDLPVDSAALLDACGLSVWRFDHLRPHPAFAPFVELEARSPYLDLSDGYEAYVAARKASGSRKLKQIARKGRKFDREAGPLTFEPHVADVAALDRLIEWKRAQYAAAGIFDLFSLGWTRDLLVELLTAESPRMTGRFGVLSAGGQMVAGDLGMRCGDVLHSWFVAYDVEHAAYGPGHVCTLRTAAAAAAEGVTRLELGKGPEEYKLSLAGDAGTVGEGAVDLRALAPLSRLGRRAYRGAKRTAADSPAAEPLRRVVRTVKRLAAGGRF